MISVENDAVKSDHISFDKSRIKYMMPLKSKTDPEHTDLLFDKQIRTHLFFDKSRINDVPDTVPDA